MAASPDAVDEEGTRVTDSATEIGSPLDSLEGEAPSKRGRRIGTGIGIAIVVLAAAYVGGVFWTADRTPREATVSGVEVGGLPSAQAVTALEDGLADRVTQPLSIRVGDIEATLDPTQAGLAVDAQASIDALTGRSWDPRVVIERLFGQVDTDAVTNVDSEALTAALSGAEDFVTVPPVDATIAFANGTAVVSDPVDGSGLDVEAAVTIIEDTWLTATDTLDLPVTTIAPTMDQATVDTAMTTIVDPLLSGPVTVVAGEATTTLEPDALTAIATVPAQDGAFVLQLDADQLTQLVDAALPGVGQASTDASFTFTNGTPTIVPSQDGTGFDPAQLAAAVTAAAQSTTERTATLELTAQEAEFSTADAEALGITEVIGEYSTPLPAGTDVPRTNNIRHGAEIVTGTLLMPGDTFSLSKTLGPINGSTGFFMSHVVESGNVSEAWGGGLSQLSTTLFNASFEAGLEDVTHQPHSRWFERYPPGREATLFEGQIDMQFKNRTDHGVLVQAWVENGRTYARLWGTKTFDTTITSGGKYAITSPKTIYNTRATCTPESGGANGFTIDVTRVVKGLDGSQVESRTYTTTYQPWNKIVCGPDPNAG